MVFSTVERMLDSITILQLQRIFLRQLVATPSSAKCCALDDRVLSRGSLFPAYARGSHSEEFKSILMLRDIYCVSFGVTRSFFTSAKHTVYD
jgi:hypothetical protein